MELAALLLNQAQLNNTSNSTTTTATASTPNTPKKQHFNGSSSLASSASSSPQPAGHTDRHRKSSSVVHVRENSLDELEALFDPSKRSSRGQKAQLPPLHKRNLPSSFFSQPKLLRHLHHNRHNNHHNLHQHHHHHAPNNPHHQAQLFHGRQMSSVDQSTYSSQRTNSSQVTNDGPIAGVNGLFAAGSGPNGVDMQGVAGMSTHLRSISEPVNMMNLSPQMQEQAQQQQQHLAGNSQFGQLPYGWQAAKTADNKVYYIK